MAQTPRGPRRRITSLDQQTLEARLRDVARDLCPDRLMDDLEVRHLIRVVTECSLLLNDVYSDERISRIMQPERDLLGGLLDGIGEERGADEDESVLRIGRLPDDVRLVGDKALFDLSLLGLDRIKGYDLAELGSRAYLTAGRALELLAEDRRLCRFFKDNRLLVLPLEQEVVFLRQCSEKFRLYADILKHTHPNGEEDLAERVPLMAAAAQALVEQDSREEAIPEIDLEHGDAYLDAARGEVAGEARITKERLISGYERILLFSSLNTGRLRDALNATVVGQRESIDTLCDDFGLFAAGTRDQRKPPAYFMVGPTGVGKNYLVESLLRLLEGVWHIQVPMLTIEGPNYTYPSDINELRGATRGFIRSDEEGILTTFHERSSRSPLGVILIDEVEKAHHHLLTFFLSILDRGTTTDNRGSVLNFANCILFFTSNLGYSDAQQQARLIGYRDEQARQEASDHDVRQTLHRALKPEFLNRVRTVHFNRLNEASIERILDLELERIARRYREVHGLSIELAPSAREELIRRGFSARFGARHLASTLEAVCNVDIAKRVLQDNRNGLDERASTIDWLREIRSGQRAFEPEEVKARVMQLARADLDYDSLTIGFVDGEFEYRPGTRGDSG